MAEEDHPDTVLEETPGMRRIKLTPEEYRAFLRWQDLTPSQKDHIIYFALKGDSIRTMIKVSDWMVGLGYLTIRAGAFAAAIIAVISVYRHFAGGSSQ